MTMTVKGAGSAFGRARTQGARRPRRLWGPGGIAILFLLPALAALLVLRLAPAAVSLIDSLFRTTLLGGTSFVGLGNYADLFGNADFQNRSAVTLLFA